MFAFPRRTCRLQTGSTLIFRLVFRRDFALTLRREPPPGCPFLSCPHVLRHRTGPRTGGGSVVSNVRAAQRAGTALVDIYYDLADADSSALTVKNLSAAETEMDALFPRVTCRVFSPII